MRQLANPSAAVTLAKSYEPFGDGLTSSGTGLTAFQFTGEQRDGTGLTYLRARYYASYLNQWIQPDLIIGLFTNPQTLNRYLYVLNNPVNRADPGGNWGFPIPAWVERLLKDHPELSQYLVESAQLLYSKNGLNRDCSTSPNKEEYSVESTNQLFTDFICEYGPESREFGADAPIAQELARSHSIYRIRERFYAGGGQALEEWLSFGIAEFAWAKFDIIFAGGQPVRFVLNVPALSVSDFLGSYHYEVSLTSNGSIKFLVTNVTSLESGTRIAFYDPTALENISLEEYISGPTLHKDAHIVSILKSKTRSETLGTMGGGNLSQSFAWQELYNPLWACLRWFPPYPIGLPFLRIMSASVEP